METESPPNQLLLLSAMGTDGLFSSGHLLRCSGTMSSKDVAVQMNKMGFRWLKVTTLEMAREERDRKRAEVERARETSTVPPKKRRPRKPRGRAT